MPEKHNPAGRRLDEALHDLTHAAPQPDPVRQAEARRDFIAQARQIRRDTAVSKPGFMRHISRNQKLYGRERRYSMSTLSKVLLIFSLIAGSATGTAFAADASAPGQLLYPVDLAIEDVQTTLAATPAAQARLGVRLAVERAAEMSRLAELGEEPTDEDILRLEAQVQYALQSAAQVDEPQMLQLLNQIQTMTQLHSGEMSEAGFTYAYSVMQSAGEQALQGMDDPIAFKAEHGAGPGHDAGQGGQGEGQGEGQGSGGQDGAGGQGSGAGSEDAPGQHGDRLQECDPAVETCEPQMDQEQERLQDGSDDGEQYGQPDTAGDGTGVGDPGPKGPRGYGSEDED